MSHRPPLMHSRPTFLLAGLLLGAACSSGSDSTGPGPTIAVPTRIVAVQQTVSGAAGSQVQVSARITDSSGAGIAGVTVTFSTGNGAIQASVTTGADGTATVTWTLPGQSGTFTATAAVHWTGSG